MTTDDNSLFSVVDAIDPPDSHEALVRRLAVLDSLLEIGKSVTSLFDVDAILRKVVSEAVSLTEADVGFLLLVDQDSGDLYLRAEKNIGEADARNFKVKMSDSIAGYVIQTGEPILLNQGSANIKVNTDLFVKALINAPLISGDEVIGVLAVNNRENNALFDGDDLRSIQALADWAAIAITNARLYQEAQRGLKSTRLINEISNSILSSLRSEEIPHRLIQQSTEILGAECGSLALVDNEAQEIEFQLAYDGDGQEITRMRKLRLPLGQGIIGAVAADGQPRIVIDVTRNPQWYSKIDDLTNFTTQEVLAVPLQSEGEIIGVVELLNKRNGDFTQDDLSMMIAVASAAAIAIQNARQYEALVTAHSQLREAQQQRIASEQWSILGRATAGLAHRIHNTTAIVPASAQDLREVLRPVRMSGAVRRDVEANLSRIERNTLLTLELVDNLLYRFHQTPVPASDVNALVQEAIDKISQSLPKTISLVTDLAESLPPVDTSNLLADAVVELMANAIKAMPKGGILTVKTSALNGDVRIEVSDTGVGIPKEQQIRIFTLFYGQDETGLGFGLWWLKTFLLQHRGDIQLESEPGKGATFIITLPVSVRKMG
jgi:two-component system NtrC family sensor kinase